MTQPSNELQLRSGDAATTIDVDRGGRLASLRVGGRELLLGPPSADDRSIRWGSFLMAPWPGRLENGRFDWRGRTIQLPRTHGRHAIHGLLWSGPWRVESASAAEASLSIDLRATGWPMAGRVLQTYRLTPGGLECEATVEAYDPMPAALGWHPWLRRDGGSNTTVDPQLRIDAGGVLARSRMLPTGAVLPLTRQTDLRAGPRLGRRRLDDTFVDVRSPVILSWPHLELRIAFGPEATAVHVYTPWNAVCVEPQTALPNALALPGVDAERAGVRFLEPGGRLTSTMSLHWARSPA